MRGDADEAGREGTRRKMDERRRGRSCNLEHMRTNAIIIHACRRERSRLNRRSGYRFTARMGGGEGGDGEVLRHH
jgi:hypothetical protein